VTHRHRDAAVGVVAGEMINGREGEHVVALDKVELDPPANPRAAQADERWLDHRGSVKDLAPGHLVIGGIEASADLGQDGHPQVVVFHDHGAIGLLGIGGPQDVLLLGIGIDPGVPIGEEGRVGVLGDMVGGDAKRFFTDCGLFVHEQPPLWVWGPGNQTTREFAFARLSPPRHACLEPWRPWRQRPVWPTFPTSPRRDFAGRG